MDDVPKNMERLGEEAREGVRDFSLALQKLAGPHLLELSVFGAAAAGTIELTRQAIRTALVLDAIDLETLWTLAAGGKRFGKQRLAAPLVFTPEYLQTSRDTFPLEFLDIQEQHVTVWGKDHFADLT